MRALKLTGELSLKVGATNLRRQQTGVVSQQVLYDLNLIGQSSSPLTLIIQPGAAVKNSRFSLLWMMMKLWAKIADIGSVS